MIVLQKVDDEDPWHGTRLGLIIQGAWASHRAFILRYLRQIAVITPYAQISFEFSSLDGRNDVSMMFKRRTTIMPDPPRQVLRPSQCMGSMCPILIRLSDTYTVLHVCTTEHMLEVGRWDRLAGLRGNAWCCFVSAAGPLCMSDLTCTATAVVTNHVRSG